MTPSLARLRIFISSPGDLSAERQAAERVVRTLARHPAYRPHYAIEAELYEDAVPAAIGMAPQQAVDEYLMHPSEADIFVCMLWQRFGTPFQLNGANYASGTEYEFEHAYRSLERTGRPIMLCYHCQRPLAHDCDLHQAGLVRAFFERLRKGDTYRGLYKSFDQLADFESKLAADLHHVIGRMLSAVPPAHAAHAAPFAHAAPPTHAAPSGPALGVSSLGDPHRLLPLDGRPTLTSPAGERVLTGGARLSFTLTGAGASTVTLHALTLKVLAYEPGPKPAYSHALAGNAIIGAGVAKVHEFAVALAHGAPGKARWITGPGAFAFARGENLLDTPQPLVFTLAPGEAEQIAGTLLVQDTGYYEVAFVFHYSSAAGAASHTSETIRLYAEA